jgi:hypothetical protein
VKKKKLYFGMSVTLPLDEAAEFKRSLEKNAYGNRCYLLKVKENPRATQIRRRKHYVVVGNMRQKEHCLRPQLPHIKILVVRRSVEQTACIEPQLKSAYLDGLHSGTGFPFKKVIDSTE